MNASTASPGLLAPALRLSGVSKSFGASQVLKDVSLTVAKGEIVCVLGPSGCGKSTLLRCINWLEEPDAGTVIVSGERMGARGAHRMSEKELARARSKIGMVFQHFALWPHLTVLQNVMEAPVHVHKRDRSEVRREAMELLERVGLADRRDHFPSQLSGGQKQRAAIARALAIRPDLLLFDEPTSALDPVLVGEVLGVMTGLAKDGMTMVIVTHEMAFARQVASRIVFMHDGRIAEEAAPARFFDQPGTPEARAFLRHFQHGASAAPLHLVHEGVSQ
jgi:polar amino acid transport system ATP-binding protein